MATPVQAEQRGAHDRLAAWKLRVAEFARILAVSPCGSYLAAARNLAISATFRRNAKLHRPATRDRDGWLSPAELQPERKAAVATGPGRRASDKGFLPVCAFDTDPPPPSRVPSGCGGALIRHYGGNPSVCRSPPSLLGGSSDGRVAPSDRIIRSTAPGGYPARRGRVFRGFADVVQNRRPTEQARRRRCAISRR